MVLLLLVTPSVLTFTNAPGIWRHNVSDVSCWPRQGASLALLSSTDGRTREAVLGRTDRGERRPNPVDGRSSAAAHLEDCEGSTPSIVATTTIDDLPTSPPPSIEYYSLPAKPNGDICRAQLRGRYVTWLSSHYANFRRSRPQTAARPLLAPCLSSTPPFRWSTRAVPRAKGSGLQPPQSVEAVDSSLSHLELPQGPVNQH